MSAKDLSMAAERVDLVSVIVLARGADDWWNDGLYENNHNVHYTNAKTTTNNKLNALLRVETDV